MSSPTPMASSSDASDSTRYYFIGAYPSAELRTSLGLGKNAGQPAAGASAATVCFSKGVKLGAAMPGDRTRCEGTDPSGNVFVLVNR
jgi:hypothetical protein